MLLLAALALIFYVILPLGGAYQVRRGWRKLRGWVTQAAESPELTFQALQQISLHSGPFLMVGALEAFEGRDTLWLGNDAVSLPVVLRRVDVYFLEDPTEGDAPGDPPRKVPWSSLGVLPEGTRFLVWGWLQESGGAARFASAPSNPLLVIAFSGASETVLARTVRDARQPIEHWNPVTPLSLVIGFGALLLAAYWELRIPGVRATGLIGLALALLPSTFFLPPGIVLFYGFARLWAQSRGFRAKRDVMEFLDRSPSTESQEYGKKARRREILAHAVLLLGAGLNALLLITILRLSIP